MKIHYHVHKSPQFYLNLSQLNAVHTLTSYFCKIHFDDIPALCIGLISGLIPLGFQTKILYAFVIFPMHTA